MSSFLVVGDFLWPWYQEACCNSLESLGHRVTRFSFFRYFRFFPSQNSEPVFHSVFHYLQYKFQLGPTFLRLYFDLIICFVQLKPTYIWLYNVHIISPFILRILRCLSPTTVFLSYTNDNAFSNHSSRLLWKKYLSSLHLIDVHFVYRHSNISDLLRRNIPFSTIHLLRSYFIPECDYPTSISDIPPSFLTDIVFAGHYEDDGRLQALEAVASLGFKLRIYGAGWSTPFESLPPSSPLRDHPLPIKPAIGDAYRYAICGAKIAICFLSTLNEDTYTRRCFQIPAMGIPLVCQYSDDLADLFSENKEYFFFRDASQLCAQILKLMSSSSLRAQVADAAYLRVYKSGHDIMSRMQFFLSCLNSDHN